MPTRLLLEGTDIRDLLQQVHDEHGPSARIVHAERIRSGGVAGFFARQRYEVAVEIDVPGLDDVPTPSLPATPGTAAVETPTPPATSSAAAIAAAMTGLAAGGAACDALLAAVERADGHQLAGVPAATVPPAAVSARLAAPAPTRTAEPCAPTVPAAPPAPPAVEATVVPLAPARGEDGVARRPLVVVGPTLSAAPVRTPAPVVDLPRAPRRPGDVLVLLGDAVPAYEAARRIAAGTRVPTARIHVASPEPTVPGVPAARRIVDVVEARLHGAQLAAGTAPAVVVVDAPMSLVVDADGRDWTAEVVSALGASAVWAVVDATRRAEDLRRWLTALPGVEALAVHGALASSDPDAVLDLGVPVAVADDPHLLDRSPGVETGARTRDRRAL